MPKRHKIEKLTPDCPDEPFHKRMRNRKMWYGLHFCYIKYSKIGLPAMELEQGIVIIADVFWCTSSMDRVVEHSAQRRSIDGPSLYSETNDPPRELIHDDQDPMAFENEGFAAEQIDAPQAVFFEVSVKAG